MFSPFLILLSFWAISSFFGGFEVFVVAFITEIKKGENIFFILLKRR